jgi:hypothetical protein
VTNLQVFGIPIEVTEAVLNHISGIHAGVVGIDICCRYEPEMSMALEVWDTRLPEFLADVCSVGHSRKSAFSEKFGVSRSRLTLTERRMSPFDAYGGGAWSPPNATLRFELP